MGKGRGGMGGSWRGWASGRSAEGATEQDGPAQAGGIGPQDRLRCQHHELAVSTLPCQKGCAASSRSSRQELSDLPGGGLVRGLGEVREVLSRAVLRGHSAHERRHDAGRASSCCCCVPWAVWRLTRIASTSERRIGRLGLGALLLAPALLAAVSMLCGCTDAKGTGFGHRCGARVGAG